MYLVWMALGLIVLVIGAEALVRGASRLALSCGISPLVIGLTIVAYGTSAPEVAVSVSTALAGKNDIAVANVVGSNIFNVLFILGVCALIRPLMVSAQIIRQELPINLGVSVLLLWLANDGGISRTDGGVLLVLLVAYSTFLVLQSRAQTKATQDEYSEAIAAATAGGWDRHWTVQLLLILGGLSLLVLGSQWLVDGAITLAKSLGVSDVVIGLTIVAAGTSLPEVATSVMATIRGERDIAIGNVIGSNTFNILGCLGASSMVAPVGLAVAPSILNFDLWVMLAVAIVSLPVFFTGRRIARLEGFVFLGYYVCYTVYLVLATQKHDALPAFSNVMWTFVVPITAFALVVSLVPRRTAVS